MTKYFKVENERIYELPADVVEVVRCKECKWRDDCEHYVLLASFCGEVEKTAPLEYCSYAERIEGGSDE